MVHLRPTQPTTISPHQESQTMNQHQAAARNDAGVGEVFVKQLVVQLRALDAYGTYDNWDDARVLGTVVLTKEQRRSLPVVGDPDEVVVARVGAFYNAVSVLIEQASGKMARPLVHLSHEGFGTALIRVGHLVVVDRVLRDVHRFGFDSPKQLAAEGGKLVETALDWIHRYPQVAAE